MHTGKCPKCDEVAHNVYFEDIIIKRPMSMSGGLNGISYLCPKCRTILGVAIDPIALKADIVREVCEALGVKPKKKA